mmetsp:Transcript_89287/g.158389  ORF Transcript_89287/g.158389 Transcript_89287/m.158389 type:complete len:354 (+) Transcript_89287:76-1137(+)
MGGPNGSALARRRQTSLLSALLTVAKSLTSRTAISMLLGGLIAALIRHFQDWRRRLREQKAESLWRRHVDFSVVQACILTTEHLAALGRVEKRTMFVKPISEVFRNEYILERLLATAEQAVAAQEPFLVTMLSQEDKWHVLNTCSNHLSSCFAPYHVFFNEARRVESYYQSAWYCFTLTCAQTEASGRWFITPYKPVGKDDVGFLRIRIVMMNEQELREIASGSIEPPSFGFFNGRHESRWRVCQRFAELFERQVTRVTGEDDVNADWGPNLCGRLSQANKNRRSSASNHAISSMPAESGGGSPPVPDYQPEDNSILRIHVPYPASSHRGSATDDKSGRHLEDCVSRDVVLFE